MKEINLVVVSLFVHILAGCNSNPNPENKAQPPVAEKSIVVGETYRHAGPRGGSLVKEILFLDAEFVQIQPYYQLRMFNLLEERKAAEARQYRQVGKSLYIPSDGGNGYSLLEIANRDTLRGYHYLGGLWVRVNRDSTKS